MLQNAFHLWNGIITLAITIISNEYKWLSIFPMEIPLAKCLPAVFYMQESSTHSNK